MWVGLTQIFFAADPVDSYFLLRIGLGLKFTFFFFYWCGFGSGRFGFVFIGFGLAFEFRFLLVCFRYIRFFKRKRRISFQAKKYLHILIWMHISIIFFFRKCEINISDMILDNFSIISLKCDFFFLILGFVLKCAEFGIDENYSVVLRLF